MPLSSLRELSYSALDSSHVIHAIAYVQRTQHELYQADTTSQRPQTSFATEARRGWQRDSKLALCDIVPYSRRQQGTDSGHVIGAFPGVPATKKGAARESREI